MIKQLAIVGGTHGNEFTGIYLLKKWQDNIELIQRGSFNTETVFGNPEAYQANKRYINSDLNRRFNQVELENRTLTGLEEVRAKQINQQLGPKGDPRIDFIIDVHTTTSNMGPTLLLTAKGKFYNQLAAYVQMNMPEVVISCDEDHKTNQEQHFLSSIAKHSVMVEVGPVPQSVLRHDVFEQSERMTLLILDFIELYNTDQLPQFPVTIDAFRFLETISLPLNSKGERIAMIHRDIQDKDFAAIEPGQPLFVTFAGEEICYQGDTTVYGSFINEAAYYDNNLAMSLMEKVTLNCR
ncbi:MAG: aspartoacylase [Gammaproteobacteria bacterium]|nr:aspartoacylase [Gammaproteobacteria bacterium]